MERLSLPFTINAEAAMAEEQLVPEPEPEVVCTTYSYIASTPFSFFFQAWKKCVANHLLHLLPGTVADVICYPPLTNRWGCTAVLFGACTVHTALLLHLPRINTHLPYYNIIICFFFSLSFSSPLFNDGIFICPRALQVQDHDMIMVVSAVLSVHLATEIVTATVARLSLSLHLSLSLLILINKSPIIIFLQLTC